MNWVFCESCHLFSIKIFLRSPGWAETPAFLLLPSQCGDLRPGALHWKGIFFKASDFSFLEAPFFFLPKLLQYFYYRFTCSYFINVLVHFVCSLILLCKVFADVMLLSSCFISAGFISSSFFPLWRLNSALTVLDKHATIELQPQPSLDHCSQSFVSLYGT